MIQKLSRKRREAERHKDEILDAAEKVFAEKGFVSVSMEDIAQSAEFAVGTLYKFFRSKEELYSEIIMRKTFLYAPRIEKALNSDSSPLKCIHNYFQARLDLFWEDQRFFRLFLNQTMITILDERAGFKPELIQVYFGFLEKMQKVFEEGISKKEFRPLKPIMLVLLLEGMVRPYVSHVLRINQKVRDREEEEEIWDFFLRGALIKSPGKKQKDKVKKG
ncbi:TetR/AcrR family transcriptional regulator [Candidatus Sumerlaeota bacterium]|nr:TetR/AcrR family transcriptional regulator [Candidatus Sumerlaeota bacterium]